ncbi:hypothetical protein [Spartinivicinus ruber]|uniref:hypothetical protein n=1 Tax=Spartinivicinus ruber TaxID=2683272 RepID=UPI0013D45010|nr:hypothetical protein [Spartinivicinus ruber]
MNIYNEQYYITIRPINDNQLYLKPDKKTEHRDYDFRKLQPGGAPLFLENGTKEKDKRLGKQRHLTDVLMEGSNLLVNDNIRNHLVLSSIKVMQLYPAIYIDDDDEDDDIDYDAEVTQYYLDDKVLDEIPEHQRLMFKMGGATKAYIFAHQVVVDFFTSRKISGVRFMKVSTFKEGDQFRPWIKKYTYI